MMALQPTGLHLACEDNLAFMEKLHDGQMKLIVTSPPYNLGKDYEEAKSSLDTYLAAQERVITECVRLLHPQGSLCWQVGNYVHNGEIVPLDAVLYPVFRSFGLKLRNRIVWHFGHGLHCNDACPGATRLSIGGQRVMTTPGILIRLGCRRNILTSAISKAPRLANCRVTRKERTQAMCGSFRTSNTITRRRPSTHASFPLN